METRDFKYKKNFKKMEITRGRILIESILSVCFILTGLTGLLLEKVVK